MLMKLSFIVILMSAFALADCSEIEIDSQTLRLTALAAILENQNSSALDLAEQRIYVNPEKIAITYQGLIAYVTDEKTVVLPELFSDSNGCFVTCSDRDLELLYQNDELRAWWCPSCRAFRSMNKYGCCTSCGRKL